MDNKARSKFLFMILFFMLIVVSFLIIKPYLMGIMSGLLLGYIFHPVYRRVLKVIPHENVVAFAVACLVVVAVLVPLLLLGQMAVSQAKDAYSGTVSRLKSSHLFASAEECANDTTLPCRLNEQYHQLIEKPAAKTFIDLALQRIAEGLWNLAPSLIFAIPQFILSLITALMVMFASLKEGETMIQRLREFVPLSRKEEELMFTRIQHTIHALLYGHLLAGISQGIASALGLLILGVNSPVFWGAVMAVTAMIPFVGAPVVWLPLALGLILDGSTSQGILLIAYDFLVVSTIDNVIRAVVVGDRTRVSSVLIFIGVLGGVTLMGFPGIIFGPLILTVTTTVLSSFPDGSGN